MKTEQGSNECLAVVGSMTLAMKAQAALSEAAVLSYVRKIDAVGRMRGCAYGVSYDCRQEATVAAALKRAGVRWRRERGTTP